MSAETEAAKEADWREVEGASGAASATWLVLDRTNEAQSRARSLSKLLEELVSARGDGEGISREALFWVVSDLHDHVTEMAEGINHAQHLLRPVSLAEKAAAERVRAAERDTPEAMERQAETYDRMVAIAEDEAAKCRARAAKLRQAVEA